MLSPMEFELVVFFLEALVVVGLLMLGFGVLLHGIANLLDRGAGTTIGTGTGTGWPADDNDCSFAEGGHGRDS